MEIVRPRWSTWSFLVYAGGFVFASALGGWVSYLATHSGNAAEALWALVAFVVLVAAAEGFRRTEHRVTAAAELHPLIHRRQKAASPARIAAARTVPAGTEDHESGKVFGFRTKTVKEP